jgi:hypothetical protein
MSAYFNLPLEINIMICTICSTESFAWLAEVFVCPVCGSFEYAYPTSINDGAEHSESADIDVQEWDDRNRKRKRTHSGDGDA